MVQLCGHRLHVHPSFQLYLTTTTPPTAIPSSLRDDVTVVSCDVTMAVAQDLILEAAVGLLGSNDMKGGFRTSCEGVATCRSQLKQLEQELIEQLPSPGKEQSYWLCTEKIATTVTKKNEVITAQYNLPIGYIIISYYHSRKSRQINYSITIF